MTPTFMKTNVTVQSVVFKRRTAPIMPFSDMQNDSKLLSGCPFLRHGNADSNVESLCIVAVALNANP
jgi:hypothetical protein